MKPLSFKKHIAMLLTFCMVIGQMSVSAFAVTEGNTEKAATEPYFSVISSKEYAISPGVVERTVVLNDKTGANQNVGHVMEVDLSNPNVTFLSGYRNMDPSKWGTQITSEQAKAAEKVKGVNVVGAINTNLSWSTVEPLGNLVIDGEVHHQGPQDYFAMTKDRRGEIRQGTVPLNGNELQATSAFDVIAENGKNLLAETHSIYEKAPRTAIGIKADGKVIMFVVDGRQAPYSTGMTLYELAETLLDMGCVDVLNCDGGGSSTFVSERAGSGELAVRNTPSDGVERPTLGTLMVVSTAKPTGEFDHAVVTPNNDLYTPESEIKFEAAGVDSAGSKAPLPAGLKWRLAKDSITLGTIDENTGVFVGAPKATGKVSVELVQGDKVVGSTSVQLVIPDHIGFSSEEVSLGFNETKDFKLTVKNNMRDVIYKHSDFNWELSDARLGKFNPDGTFTSSDGMSLTGTLTTSFKTDSRINAKLKINVGLLPTVVWDFEDVKKEVPVKDPVTGQDKIDPETGKVVMETITIPAKDYYTIDKKEKDPNDPNKEIYTSLLHTSNYNRGGVQSAEIVSIDDQEPVRLGKNALKLNYDFRNCGAVTEGACIGTTKPMDIPGNPTAIGVWVYAPEGAGIKWQGDGTTAGLWLRGQYKDNTGATCQYDFTFEPKMFGPDQSKWPDKYPGIWWEGWRYLEADLNGQAPYSIIKGMTFRLMFVHSTKMGERTAGSLYFDNLQFVYGTNVDDTTAPVLGRAQIYDGPEEVPLKDGMTISSNYIESVMVDFFDNTSKYDTGVDPATTRIYVDGVNVINDSYYNTHVDKDGRVYLSGFRLQNGWHTITAYAKDKAGNETTKVFKIFVNGKGLNIPSVVMNAREEAAIIGGSVNLDLKTSNPASSDNYKCTFKLDKNFPDYTVTFADGYQGTYSYNKLNKTISVDAKKISAAAGEVVATVNVKVPSTLKSWDKFTYSVESIQYSVGNEKHTNSQEKVTLGLDCMYQISAEPFVVGEPGTISIASKGAKLEGVGIYLANGTLLGNTDVNGNLVTSELSKAAGNHVVYAKDAEGRMSFEYTIGVYTSEGDAANVPYGVMNNASTEGGLGHNVTWFTGTKAPKQVLQYKAVGDTKWTTVDATTKRVTFTKGANTIVSVHSAKTPSLPAGKNYIYRVGSEGLWSQEMSFTTSNQDGRTSFFVMGDIQTPDHTQVQQIVTMLKAGNYDFAIQTGDAVDDTTSQNDWMNIVNLFDVESMDDTDVVHVLGNHEFEGDATAQRSSDIFNLPAAGAGSCYSTVYDNIYVAVLNYTTNKAQLQEALKWLEADAAKTTADWKILTLHQPPYYTNLNGGNADVHEILPPVAEKIGFDVVFSGHDHSYARTKPMINGKEDPNGVTYIISGSTGEKSYGVTNNPDFNFAVATDQYNSVFLTANASANKLSIQAYDIDAAGNKIPLDSVDLQHVDCVEHDYIYTPEDGKLTCKVCKEYINAKEAMYNGWATDKAGNRYYFLAGDKQSGLTGVNGETRYFDKNGVAYNGEYVIAGKTCTFKDGKYVSCTDTTVSEAGWAGEKVEYVYYKDGRMVLSGSGAMYEFPNNHLIPWVKYKENIKEIFIGKDITTIGKNAFRLAHFVEKITFEEGSKLKSINYAGFHYMVRIKEVILPETVEKIDWSAFGYAQNLKRVYIPEKTVNIHDGAFIKHNPDLVLSVVENSPAHKYALTKGIKVELRKPPVSMVAEGKCGANLTWKLDSTGLLEISGTGAMDDYPDWDKVPWQKYKARIKTVKIGSEVTQTGRFAFHNIPSLTKVEFAKESKLKTIGWGTFQKTGLTTIEIPASVTDIQPNAFNGCVKLETVTFAANSKLERICGLVFDGNTALVSVYIPDGVKTMYANTFRGCNASLKLNVLDGSYGHKFAVSNNIAVEVRSNITEPIPPTPPASSIIAEGKCGTDLTWKLDDTGVLEILGTGAMDDYPDWDKVPWQKYKARIKTVKIGSEVTQTGRFAFHNIPSLTKVEFAKESKLKTIGWGTFQKTGLTTIEIPASVTDIQPNAFNGCVKLETVTFAANSKLERICGLVFDGNTALVSVYIPDGVKTMYANTFRGCNASLKLNVLDGSYGHKFAVSNNIAVEVRSNISAPSIVAEGKCGTDLTWKLDDTGVLEILGTGAMDDYPDWDKVPWQKYKARIKTVKIGSEVTQTGRFAFHNIPSLTKVEFAKESKLKTIGWGTFQKTGLTTIEIPASVTDIQPNAFNGCVKLETVTFAANSKLERICGLVFDGNTALVSVYIPDGVKTMYANTFRGCNASLKLNVLDGSYGHKFAVSNNIAVEVR